MIIKYGDKRDYPKINLFEDGEYIGSTTWSKTCKDAIARCKSYPGHVYKITAHFDKGGEL